jgi:copper resistance protein C
MRLLIAIITAAAVIAFAAGPANAHAHLDHASPPVGATVQAAPHDVTIWFTQNLEPAFSTVEVTDTGGSRVDDGKPQISGNTMTIALKAVSAGTYKVHWHAVSVDTHTTQGDFNFTVGGQ